MLDSWEVLKHDIVVVVHLFQETGCIPKGCNASFITLVPKVKEPISLDQYKTISLEGSLYRSLYKIITKVLSFHIKKVLPEVIDDCQSTFLRDRGMLDHYKKIWNYIPPKFVCKTKNPYAKHSYIRIIYKQKSICKTVVGKSYIRILDPYVITYELICI